MNYEPEGRMFESCRTHHKQRTTTYSLHFVMLYIFSDLVALVVDVNLYKVVYRAGGYQR
jgi:hypothetical protein